MVVQDLSGDGELDLAVANRKASTVPLLLGNGTGCWALTTTTLSPAVRFRCQEPTRMGMEG